MVNTDPTSRDLILKLIGMVFHGYPDLHSLFVQEMAPNLLTD